MGGLTATDRAELEQLRDGLVARMEQLDDSVSYGTMTDEQRYSTLEQEFGPDYYKTLREVNSLLHSKNPRPQRHAAFAGATVIVVLVLAMAAGFIYPDSGVVGAAAMERTVLAEPLFLVDGASARLDIPVSLTINDVLAEYRGPGEFALFLNDGTGRHQLLHGTKNQMFCDGCRATYNPPYLLELKSQGGSLTVTEIIR